MAGRSETAVSGRGRPLLAAVWVAGLVMGLALAAFILWDRSIGPALVIVTATPVPASSTPAPPPATATPVPSATPIPPSATPSPTPSATSSPTPLVTPAPPGAVFGLAWFHKPPEDGSSAAQIAAENRYIHLTGPSDLGFRDELRAAGYAGPIYDYVGAASVEGPGPYKDASAHCTSDYQPFDNTVAWGADDFCIYVHPHESWFLHNSQGERLVLDYFGGGHWTYLMNPADPGWQAFSYARLRYARDVWHYDGVWLDNLDLDLSRAKNDMKNSDGQVQEYASDAAWQAAMQKWLAGLRSAVGSWQIWANLLSKDITSTAWDPYMPYLDGAMEESFSVSWIDNWRPAAEWVADLERAARWLAAGKGLVMVGQGHQSDTDRMEFTLASYLLVAQGQEAFYRYTRFDSYYNSLWLYPEYDTARALGAPTGPRQEEQPGLWRRPFEHGYVEVDLSRHSGRLVLDGP